MSAESITKSLRFDLDHDLAPIKKGRSPTFSTFTKKYTHLFDTYVRDEVSGGWSCCCEGVIGIGCAYFCKNCARYTDALICASCFNPEEHVGHTYRVRVDRNFECECGNVDAWKRPFCGKHTQSKSVEERMSALSPEVIPSLQEIVGCTLSGLRKCILAAANTKEAKSLSSAIACLSINLLQIAKCGEIAQRVVAETICEGKDAILQFMMDHERNARVTNPWTGDYKRLHTLVTKLMPDPVFKMQFARALVRNYTDICDARCKTGGVGKDLISLQQLSQRFFTVPRIVRDLTCPKNFGDRGLHALHFILLGLLHSAVVMKKRKSQGTRRPFDVIRPYAKQVEACFDNLNDALQSDVETVGVLLKDELLIKLLCQVLLLCQETTTIDNYEDSDSMFRDVYFILNRSIQETIKIIALAVPGLAAHGFTWTATAKMPACSNIDEDPFLSKVLPKVIKQIEKGTSPLGQCFDSAEKLDSLVHTLKNEPSRKLYGFEVLFAWVFAFLIKYAPNHARDTDNFTLPFHRLFGRVASAVSQHFSVNVIGLVPADIDEDAMRKACEGPMNVQQNAAFDHDIPSNGLPGSDAMPLYEMSSISEYDIIFLQIGMCHTGPHLFEEILPISPSADEQDSESERIRYLQLMIILATRVELSAQQRYERTIARCLMTETQKYTDFFVAHRTRYDLCSEDGAVEYMDPSMGRELSFAKMAKRTNTTNPATYTLKEEYYDRLSIYDADIALDDLSALIIACENITPRIELAPSIPNSGPFIHSIFMLHCEFQVQYAMGEVTDFCRKKTSCEESLRLALDFLISAIKTYDLQNALFDTVWAQKEGPYKTLRQRIDMQCVDIIEYMYLPIGAEEADKTAPIFIETLQRLAVAPDASGLAWKVDALLDRIHAVESKCHGIKTQCFKDVDFAAIKAQSLQIISSRKDSSKVPALTAKVADLKLIEPTRSNLEHDIHAALAALTCVSCKRYSNTAGALGLIVHTSHSNVLNVVHCDKYPPNISDWFEMYPDQLQSLVCPPDSTMHVWTCGHAIHDECRQKALAAQRKAKQTGAKPSASVAVGDEFLCPACGQLASGALPIGVNAKEIAHAFGPTDLHRTPSDTVLSFPIGISPTKFPEKMTEQSKAALEWLYEQKCKQAVACGEVPVGLERGCVDSAIRVFGTQIILCELQARLDPTCISINKILVLRALLENIIVKIRAMAVNTVEHTLFVATQRAFDSIYRGKALYEGSFIADVEPFTLFIQLFARFVLTGDGRANIYRRLREITARVAWQNAYAIEAVQVFMRQATLLDMVVRPERFATQDLDKALEITPVDFIPIFGDDHFQFFPGGESAHRPPALRDHLDLPHFSEMPDDFLKTLLKRCRERCTVCQEMAYRRGMCLYCGTIVCIYESCCPKECWKHSLDCGGGCGLYAEIGEFSTRVFYMNALTFQCAYIQPPWVDIHGETDVGCVRGKSLYKCPSSVRKLLLTWLEGMFLQATDIHIEKAWVWTDKRL